MTELDASSMPGAYAGCIADALHVVDAEEKRPEQSTNGESFVTFRRNLAFSDVREEAHRNG